MKTSMKRINGTERGAKPVRPKTLASQGHQPCCGSVAMSLPHTLISIRPQGLAACLLHDAKPSSQHASGWLASSFSFVSNKQFFMNLEKSTTLSSLKIEFHAKRLRYNSEKIEFHARRLRYHSEKIEMSLSEAVFAYFAVFVSTWTVVCSSFIHH